MDELLSGTWEEFEAWIRETIGGNFRWNVRPQDTASNREMVASLIRDEMERNKDVFPDGNTFIQRK